MVELNLTHLISTPSGGQASRLEAYPDAVLPALATLRPRWAVATPMFQKRKEKSGQL